MVLHKGDQKGLPCLISIGFRVTKTKNLLAIIRLGVLDPRLMLLAVKLKRDRRTYLSFSTLYSLASNSNRLYKQTRSTLEFAEFGVGRGGSATLLAWFVNKYKGTLSLYDIFGRIPAPTSLDGERALDRYDVIIKQEGEDYYGNIENLLEVVKSDISKVCPLTMKKYYPGCMTGENLI
jgi:hypothetical protein